MSYEYSVRVLFPANSGRRAIFETEREALNQVEEWHIKFGGYVTFDPETKTFTVLTEWLKDEK